MQKIKKLIKNILISILPKRYILFESVPDVSDNSKAVFDEMLRRGLNKKYTLVWMLYGNDCECYPKIKNVKYYQPKDIGYEKNLKEVYERLEKIKNSYK